MEIEKSEEAETYYNAYISESEESSESIFQGKKTDRKMRKRRDRVPRRRPPPTKWTDSEIIVLFEAIIEFRREKGFPEKNNMTQYYQFIKDRLWEGVTTKQIYEKLRSLKRNFLKINNKSSETSPLILSSATPTLGEIGENKDHENTTSNVYELSKMIWDYPQDQDQTTHVVVAHHHHHVHHVPEEEKEKEKEKDHHVHHVSEEEKEKEKEEDDDERHNTHHYEWVNNNLSASEFQDQNDDFRTKYPHLYNSLDQNRIMLLDHLFLIGDEKASQLNDTMLHLNIKQEKLHRKIRWLEIWQAHRILSLLKTSTSTSTPQI